MSEPCKQETRIAKLESTTESQATSIIYLGDQIKGLASEMRWQNRLVLTVLLSAIAYFLKQQIGG